MPALYGVLSLVLVAGALTFALSSPPPNTPPLAAVAPAPQENIEVERVEQSSQFGAGEGGEGDCVPGDSGCEGSGEPQAAPPVTETPPAVEQTRAHGELRRCVTGPGGPRQTQDPQSPPCRQEIFEGDNGGSTWRGVTATEIRIAYDPEAMEGSNQENLPYFPAWVAHFNQYYELYGRKIQLVPVELSGKTEPEAQRADARTIAEADVFATLGYRHLGAHQDELAHLGVVFTVNGYRARMPTRGQLDRWGPHGWSVYPTLDENLTATGALICSSLTGRVARHGGADVSDRQRLFGLLVGQRGSEGVRYETTVLARRLEACGAPYRTYTFDDTGSDVEMVMQRMAADGVTTIVCVCDGLESEHTAAAEDLGFRPEWLLPAIDDSWVMLRQRRATGEVHPYAQMAHVFGLWSGPRRPPAEGVGRRYRVHDEWWFRAAREQDPGIGEPGNGYPYGFYAELLTLASGIQWAGPALTPGSFAAALHTLRFPNPNVGAAPWYQASVGFGPQDHAFASDYALFWWRNPDEASHDSRTDIGEACFVGNGQRFTPSTLPANADDLLFDVEAGCR